MQQQP